MLNSEKCRETNGHANQSQPVVSAAIANGSHTGRARRITTSAATRVITTKGVSWWLTTTAPKETAPRRRAAGARTGATDRAVSGAATWSRADHRSRSRVHHRPRRVVGGQG